MYDIWTKVGNSIHSDAVRTWVMSQLQVPSFVRQGSLNFLGLRNKRNSSMSLSKWGHK